MTAVEREQLELSLQNITIGVLDELAKHKVKWAELMKQAIEEFKIAKPQIEQWYETLKVILIALKPVFEIVREWLVAAYSHLVDLFDWAKKMWQEIFG